MLTTLLRRFMNSMSSGRRLQNTAGEKKGSASLLSERKRRGIFSEARQHVAARCPKPSVSSAKPGCEHGAAACPRHTSSWGETTVQNLQLCPRGHAGKGQGQASTMGTWPQVPALIHSCSVTREPRFHPSPTGSDEKKALPILTRHRRDAACSRGQKRWETSTTKVSAEQSCSDCTAEPSAPGEIPRCSGLLLTAWP